jgi:hypothetical protein
VEGVFLVLILLYLPGGIFGGLLTALQRLGRVLPRGPAVETAGRI